MQRVANKWRKSMVRDAFHPGWLCGAVAKEVGAEDEVRH
jgi:hypothetical protein